MSYAAPHRQPDALMQSALPDAHVRIWQGVRSVQGGRFGEDVPPTSYSLAYIGARCGKTSNAVSKALIPLKAFGWVEEVGREGKTLLLRCHIGRNYRWIKGKGHVEVSTPHGNHHDASREGIEQDRRLTGIIMTPHGKDDDASRESSPTPPNKEDLLPSTPICEERARLIGLVGEDAPGLSLVTANQPLALAVYVALAGRVPKLLHWTTIGRSVGTVEADLRVWADIVATWAATHEPGHVGKPYNLGNVSRMLETFAEGRTAAKVTGSPLRTKSAEDYIAEQERQRRQRPDDPDTVVANPDDVTTYGPLRASYLATLTPAALRSMQEPELADIAEARLAASPSGDGAATPLPTIDS